MRTILLFLLSTIAYGQSDLFESEVIIDRTHEDAHKIIRSRDGNYLIVGSTDRGGKDIYIIKANDKGDTLWTKKYGADNVDDYATDIVATSNGYAVCGSTRGYSQKGKDDAFLLLIDETGEWTAYPNVFGSEFDDEAKKIIQTKDGNLVMSRPEIGLHELTCKHYEKIRENCSRTRSHYSRIFAGRYDLS